jgi:hypothetical protein
MVTHAPDNSNAVSRHRAKAIETAEKGVMRRDESRMSLEKA